MHTHKKKTTKKVSKSTLATGKEQLQKKQENPSIKQGNKGRFYRKSDATLYFITHASHLRNDTGSEKLYGK